jgi:hypothetical protein
MFNTFFETEEDAQLFKAVQDAWLKSAELNLRIAELILAALPETS